MYYRPQCFHPATLTGILVYGFVMGALAFVNFGIFIYRTGADLDLSHQLYPRATTVSYATIALCQFVNILSRRYRYASVISRNFWTNPKLLWSIVLSICLTLIAVYTPGLSRFLGFASLTGGDWLTILGAALVYLFSHELLKFVRRHRQREGEAQIES